MRIETVTTTFHMNIDGTHCAKSCDNFGESFACLFFHEGDSWFTELEENEKTGQATRCDECKKMWG